MFVVDKENNRIEKIQSHSFSDLGFKEREHLQEWLENNPDAFGEELLFIQKEFDRFDDTRERLDLLAIDKVGNLVVIENKLDDSGRDVTWQALKYAAYCSTLTKQQIKNIYQLFLDKKGLREDSETNISDFFDGRDFDEIQLNKTQRVIFVAANYRKEVTSTVLWLLSTYNLQIQCFKVTPYKLEEQIFLNIEQIIPVKEAKDFIIRMAEKAQEEQHLQEEQEERFKFRFEFWQELLQKFNGKSDIFANVSPSKTETWIRAGLGMSGVGLYFVITKKYAGVQVEMARGDRAENEFIFEKLLEHKAELEAQTGELVWEKIENRKVMKIKRGIGNVNYFKKEDWSEMMAFMMGNMLKFDDAFRKIIPKISQEFKTAFKN